MHIEARVNWDKNNIPQGARAHGFVPYLRITAHVINQRTKLSSFIDLLPHINLVDNFHYARNMTLPGRITDRYRVIFNITAPSLNDLALHRDWVMLYGKQLLRNQRFVFKNINFEEITKATR